jgi:cytidylate kinase
VRLYKIRKKRSAARLVATIALFILLAAGLWFGASRVSRQETAGQRQRLQEAICRAAVNCYAVEGCYPADVTYLEEHYGIQIDYTRYSVWYECIGANVMPTVVVAQVQEVGGGQ